MATFKLEKRKEQEETKPCVAIMCLYEALLDGKRLCNDRLADLYAYQDELEKLGNENVQLFILAGRTPAPDEPLVGSIKMAWQNYGGATLGGRRRRRSLKEQLQGAYLRTVDTFLADKAVMVLPDNFDLQNLPEGVDHRYLASAPTQPLAADAG